MPPPYNHHTYNTGFGTGTSSNPYSNSNTRPSAAATPSTHMNMNMTMNMYGGGTNPTSYSTPGTSSGFGSGYSAGSSASASSSMSAAKTRQYAQLQASLAQLNANLSDTQNLVRMTAVQAEDMRFLGGYVGALFMGSAKVLGEEGVIKGGRERRGEEVEMGGEFEGGDYGEGMRVKRES